MNESKPAGEWEFWEGANMQEWADMKYKCL